ARGEGLLQDGAEVVRVGGAVVEQDGGAQAVGGGDEGGDGGGVVGEGGGEFGDVLAPAAGDGAQGGSAGGEGGEFAFGEGAVAAGAGGFGDEFGQLGQLVAVAVDDLADAGGVGVGDAGQGGDEEVVEGGEVVRAQGRGDAGLFGDGAVGDAGGAVAGDHGQGGVDDLGSASGAAGEPPVNTIGHVTLLGRQDSGGLVPEAGDVAQRAEAEHGGRGDRDPGDRGGEVHAGGEGQARLGRLGAVDRGGEAAQEGHADGDAEFLDGLRQGGGRAGLRRRGRADHDVGAQGGDRAQAEVDEGEPGGDRQFVVQARGGQQGVADQGDAQGGAHDVAGPHAPGQERRADAGGEHRQRRRPHPQARRERAQPFHHLEVLGDQVHGAAHADEPDEQHGQRRAEGPVREQGDVEQRVVQAALPAPEQDSGDHSYRHRD